MSDTPSQEIIASGKAAVSVQDANGRDLGVRKINTLDRMRLLELVGPDLSNNDRYIGLAMLAYAVTSIGGDPILRPTSKAQLEAVVQRLDDDGFNAVSKAVVDNFISARTTDEAKAAVKNG